MKLLKLYEDHVYDKLQQLRSKYDKESSKIRNDKSLNHKQFKFKSDRLMRQYFKDTDALTKQSNDPYALKGDPTVKYIYHYTTVENLIGILEEDIMYESGEGVSFTSNPNLYKRGFVFWWASQYDKGRGSSNAGAKIKFDFQKMKKDYRFNLGSEDKGTHEGEEELYVLKDIENVTDYIVEVIILTEKESDPNLIEKCTKLLQKKNNIKYKIINN